MTARPFGSLNNRHEIKVLCDPKLPEIRGDAIHLEQVIVNLLSNAIDVLAEHRDLLGEIEIVAQQASESTILISVHDNGPGIDAERATGRWHSDSECRADTGVTAQI